MISNTTKCDLCHREVPVTPSCLETKFLALETSEAGGVTNTEVTLFTCPSCGKSYAVVVDTEETKALLTTLKGMYLKRTAYSGKGKTPPKKLEMKIHQLNNKLDFQRHKLAKEFDGAFYQTDAGKEQLDYRYHVR